MTPAPAKSSGLKLAIDYGPLLTFFVVNSFGDRLRPLLIRLGMAPVTKNIFIATAAFMVAILVAIVVSRWKLGRVSAVLWFTGAVVGVFGAATLYFQDETFIKLKPTILYATFAVILLFGLATDRPLLKPLLGEVFPNLDAIGWRKLTRNWMLFFVGMAVLNEVMRRVLSSTDDWVTFKVFGVTGLTFAFALAQTPILLRHGPKDGAGQ